MYAGVRQLMFLLEGQQLLTFFPQTYASINDKYEREWQETHTCAFVIGLLPSGKKRSLASAKVPWYIVRSVASGCARILWTEAESLHRHV